MTLSNSVVYYRMDCCNTLKSFTSLKKWVESFLNINVKILKQNLIGSQIILKRLLLKNNTQQNIETHLHIWRLHFFIGCCCHALGEHDYSPKMKKKNKGIFLFVHTDLKGKDPFFHFGWVSPQTLTRPINYSIFIFCLFIYYFEK